MQYEGLRHLYGIFNKTQFKWAICSQANFYGKFLKLWVIVITYQIKHSWDVFHFEYWNYVLKHLRFLHPSSYIWSFGEKLQAKAVKRQGRPHLPVISAQPVVQPRWAAGCLQNAPSTPAACFVGSSWNALPYSSQLTSACPLGPTHTPDPPRSPGAVLVKHPFHASS